MEFFMISELSAALQEIKRASIYQAATLATMQMLLVNKGIFTTEEFEKTFIQMQAAIDQEVAGLEERLKEAT